MTDRYENIRKALDVIDECADGTLLMTRDRCTRLREAADTIRALLAEMDSLRDALEAALVDAERWRHARRILTVEDIETSQDMFNAFGVEGDEHENRKADAAIDQARGKENGNG